MRLKKSYLLIKVSHTLIRNVFNLKAMAALEPLPRLESIDTEVPNTPLILEALEYTRKHTTPTTVNHCLRAAYVSGPPKVADMAQPFGKQATTISTRSNGNSSAHS
jgi:hypothetical protein